VARNISTSRAEIFPRCEMLCAIPVRAMPLKQYEVCMEVSGPAAMFTRPDTGAAMVSYPAPTYSAAKGMFESIARLKTAFIRPLRVELCRPIQYHRYTTNYGGPLRKGNQVSAGASYQLAAVILINVCYRLHGVIEAAAAQPTSTNHLHALQEVFERRLQRGQSFRPMCLGWSEFTPNYAGPLRPETQVETTINLVVGSMLHSVFDQPVSGKPDPIFLHGVEIRKGVLEYAR
jgi:CRISPR-associated protein Cas5d